jgi:hypothetical protein
VQTRVYAKLGLVLIVASCLLWGLLLFIPLSPYSAPQKLLITSSLIVTSEILFWLGILLAGKELAHRFRRKLSPDYWWRQITNRR